MRLNYFNISDTPDELKSKRNALVKIHHPDRAKEADKASKNAIMQQINVEYEYVLKNAPKQGEKEPVFNGRFRRSTVNPTNSIRQAQDLFHALTNEKGVDMDLLVHTIKNITDFNTIIFVFAKRYGSSFIDSIIKNATDKEIQIIVDELMKNKKFKDVNIGSFAIEILGMIIQSKF